MLRYASFFAVQLNTENGRTQLRMLWHAAAKITLHSDIVSRRRARLCSQLVSLDASNGDREESLRNAVPDGASTKEAFIARHVVHVSPDSRKVWENSVKVHPGLILYFNNVWSFANLSCRRFKAEEGGAYSDLHRGGVRCHQVWSFCDCLCKVLALAAHPELEWRCEGG